MAKRYYDSAGLAKTLARVGGAAANIAHQQFNIVQQRQEASQLNTAQVGMSAAYSDFLRDLEKDPNPSGYMDRLNTFNNDGDQLRAVRESMSNSEAIRRYNLGLEVTQEDVRQRVLDMSVVNSKIFGKEAMITNLEDALATAPNTVLSAAEWGASREHTINSIVDDNIASGSVDPEQGEADRRTYLAKFRYNYARDMAFEVSDALLRAGSTGAEVVETLEQAIRLEGEAFDTWLEGQGLPAGRMADIADAYRNIKLSPDAEEELVVDVRQEVTARSNRLVKRQEEVAETNDVQLTEMWYAEDPEQRYVNRKAFAADNFAMVKQAYGDDYDSINDWIKLHGTWAAKEQKIADDRDAAATVENALQGYNTDIEAQRTALDLDAINALGVEIATDATIPADKQKALGSTLNTLRDDAIARASGKPLPEDQTLYNRHLAQLDGEISGLTDKVRDGTGDIPGLLAYKQTLLDDPMLEQQEQDRNERVDDINSLLDDMYDVESDTGSVAIAKRTAETAISTLFSNSLITPKEVRDEIKKHEGIGAITGDDAYSWYSRIENREKVLGNMHATNAFDVINRTFDARIRNANISEEERTQLAQEQATAFNMYDALINDPKVRAMLPAEQKEVYDDLLADALGPAVARQILGFIPIGGGGTLGTYENYQTVDNELTRNALYSELRVEMADDFSQTDDFAGWLADDMNSGTAFASGQMEIDGTNSIVFRHNETGLMFSQFKRTGNWWWRVKFPGEEEWQRMNSATKERLATYE